MSSSSFGIRGRVHEIDMAVPSDTPRKRRTGWLWWIAALLLCFAFWQFSSAGYIYAKAALAQHLIARSWEAGKKAGLADRPWPWADTRAVARLTVPAHGIDLFVLDGTSGRSLAFGPGHVNGTAAPGTAGNSVIVAHRDTHFAFLRGLALDEEIDVETPSGARARYRVRQVSVVDKSDTRVLDAADSPQLTLITCFPFDAVAPGTALRYVVIAELVGVRGFEPPASTSRT